MLRRIAFYLGLVALVMQEGPAKAYPERPIQIVVPFAAGSAPDLVARLLAEPLGQSLGQAVIVQNMPGAAGNIGVGHVAKAQPDGYTLVLAGDAAIVVNPAIYDKLSFDPVRDLAPISQLVVTPNVLVVGNDVPADSVAALVALARSQPGKLSYVSAGLGTSSHRAGELLKRAAGVDLLHVPYRTSALPDVVSGRVSMFFANVSTAMPLVREGKLRPLAVSSLTRSPVAPDLPTMQEAGYAGFEAVAWFGLLAPVSTPTAIVQQLHQAVAFALKQDSVRQKLLAMGADVVGSTPDAFAALIRAETPKWTAIMREAGIKAE